MNTLPTAFRTWLCNAFVRIPSRFLLARKTHVIRTALTHFARMIGIPAIGPVPGNSV